MNLKRLFIYSGTDEKIDFSITETPERADKNEGINEYIKNSIKDKENQVYKTGKVSKDIKENLAFVKDAFESPKNFDLMIREFKVKMGSRGIDAFLIFYDGLANKEFINRDILNPLMVSGIDQNAEDDAIEDIVCRRMISQAPNKKIQEMKMVIELVEFGNCAVFVDGCPSAFVADVKGWAGRSVGKPITESTLAGPQEAFNETVLTNVALIRKILKDSNLVAENIPVGSRSKTPCAIMYISGLTNYSLVEAIRNRLKNIDVEYIFSSTDIEMLIEDSALFPLPQILKTERPDRAASMLADGKVVIIVQGSPFVLVLPATAPDLIEAAEDNYVRVTEANFMRFVRVMGIFLATFLPGIFIGIALYHHESIPTDLLFAVEATREKMPFPIVLELVIMILAFELIKEASIRVPDPIGSTLGIVGGLILGQSAVEANIASPLLIIIVSISALGSFAAPSLALSRAISVIQFIFVVSGAIAGFLGLAFSVFISALYLSATEMLGVPYLSSTAFKSENRVSGGTIIHPIWKREKRPFDLKPQAENKQPHISRKWREKENK